MNRTAVSSTVTGFRSEACEHFISVVVPTRNEAANVDLLVQRLDAALKGYDAEIIFVDDSSDDTPAVIEAAATRTSRKVRLIHRCAGDRTGGLGSAVLAGLRQVSSRWVVVMDGDLQHPPEVIPELIRVGSDGTADLVVASRYTSDGVSSGLSSRLRREVSVWSTRLVKTAFPRRLGGCSDPMSGFFAVRPGRLNLDEMRPRGYKILLEILASSPRLRVTEVPFEFEPRHAGDSKASLREGLVFLRRLVALRAAGLLPSLAQPARFGAVGLTGLAVNSVALWLMVSVLSVPLTLAVVVATQMSTLWNFVLSDRLVFREPKSMPMWRRLASFAAINEVALLGRVPLVAFLVNVVSLGYLVANAVSLALLFAARFIVSDRWVFRPAVDTSSTRTGPVDLVVDLRNSPPPARSSPGELPYHYDIHGVVTLGSTVPLPELARFRTHEIRSDADIEIRQGSFGNGLARSRVRVTQYAAFPAVSYEEHLGRLSADFHVDMADTIRVVAGPLLMRSPHVLYTNVVEALLRFVMVSRGYMLLHSACLELDGRGVMISARTDTGKTGTILRLLRENSGRFLSDDMTIIDPTGMAWSYPKPLTISHHTLRAVDAGDLSAGEYRWLRLQSRLHSKQGRGIGAHLGEMNLPIMSLNSITQMVVPPPKYEIDRLVPCLHATQARIERLFIIERGPSAIAAIEADDLVDELIVNTDDAYGFPPFRYLAPALAVGGQGYEELRAEERQILARAMNGVQAERLISPDFSWADQIPRLVCREAPVGSLDP